MLAEKLEPDFQEPEVQETPKALQIYVARGRDGDAYEMDYFSRRWLQQTFPGARMVPRVYLGHTTRRDAEPVLKNIWEQVVILLAGISSARIAEHGVARIAFLEVGEEDDRELEGYDLSR